MADDVARAVGANSADCVIINGKECTPRPLGIAELAELERSCLQFYKRKYLDTYLSNLDLIPENLKETLIREKMDQAASWDVVDLPPKMAVNSDRIVVNEKTIEFLKTMNLPSMDHKISQKMISAAIDSGAMSSETYKKLTGEDPPRYEVGYVNWWVTGTIAGRMEMAYLAFRRSGVTRDEIADHLGKNAEELLRIAKSVESLTEPQVKNG